MINLSRLAEEKPKTIIESRGSLYTSIISPKHRRSFESLGLYRRNEETSNTCLLSRTVFPNYGFKPRVWQRSIRRALTTRKALTFVRVGVKVVKVRTTPRLQIRKPSVRDSVRLIKPITKLPFFSLWLSIHSVWKKIHDRRIRRGRGGGGLGLFSVRVRDARCRVRGSRLIAKGKEIRVNGFE